MSSGTSLSPRIARKRARARAEILDAACEVIREEGVGGLTIESVAALAEVSKPAVYYYFASKEDLTRAVAVDRSRHEIEALRRAIAEAPAGTSVVAAVVRAYVSHHLASLHLFRAEYAWGQILGVSGEAGADIDGEMVALFDAFERRLGEDEDRGLLQDGLHLRRVAVSTWSAAHGLVALLSVLDSSGSRFLHDVEDMLDELCGMLTRGIYRADQVLSR
jgi:TetR/AcrR family transcriptional regulator